MTHDANTWRPVASTQPVRATGRGAAARITRAPEGLGIAGVGRAAQYRRARNGLARHADPALPGWQRFLRNPYLWLTLLLTGLYGWLGYLSYRIIGNNLILEMADYAKEHNMPTLEATWPQVNEAYWSVTKLAFYCCSSPTGEGSCARIPAIQLQRPVCPRQRAVRFLWPLRGSHRRRLLNPFFVRNVFHVAYRKLPQDPELLVRVVGGLKVGAGSLLGLGRCPRLSAGVLALLSVPTIVARHAFWETQDVEEKVARRQGFLTSVALLGGLVITSMDTGGKPGLGWRVRQALPSRAESESMVSQAADWLGDASGRVVQYVEDNRED